MTVVASFRDLKAWKQGMSLVEHCYSATRHFPVEERYGLTTQLRRAAVSIPSNVAEEHSRKTTGAYANHVSIACGSAGELETCLLVSERLGFLSSRDASRIIERCIDVRRILTGLYSALQLKLLAAQPVREPHGARRRLTQSNV